MTRDDENETMCMMVKEKRIILELYMYVQSISLMTVGGVYISIDDRNIVWQGT